MKYVEEKCSCFWSYKRFQVYQIFWCENKFGARRNLIIMRLASLISLQSLQLQHFLWNFVFFLEFINFVSFFQKYYQVDEIEIKPLAEQSGQSSGFLRRPRNFVTIFPLVLTLLSIDVKTKMNIAPIFCGLV